MKSQHIVVEKYDHYERRKKRELVFGFKWLFPLVLFIGSGIIIEVSKTYNVEGFAVGVIMMLVAVVWLGASVYVTFFQK